jgi:hypothetical protein
MKNTLTIQALTSKLFILASASVFTFCREDDKPPGAQFSYTIDGKSASVEHVSASLHSNPRGAHEGRSLNLIFLKVGVFKSLYVDVSNWDFQNPPDNGVLTGEYDAAWDYENTQEENPLANCLSTDDGLTLCDGGLVKLFLENDFYSSVFDGNTSATITISKCDPSSRTVSGTFNVKVGLSDGSVQHTVTGSFDNVEYTIR